MFRFVVLGPDDTTSRFVLDLMFAGAIHNRQSRPFHHSFYEEGFFIGRSEHGIVVHHEPNWRHPFGYLDDAALFIGEQSDLQLDEVSFNDWQKRFREVIFLSPGQNSAELRKNMSAAVAQMASILDEPHQQTLMLNVNLLNPNVFAEKMKLIADFDRIRPMDEIIVKMCMGTPHHKSYTEQLLEYFLGLEYIFCLSPERFHHWYALSDNDPRTNAIEQDIHTFRKNYESLLKKSVDTNFLQIPIISKWRIIKQLIRVFIFKKMPTDELVGSKRLQKQFDTLILELRQLAARMASF